LSPQGQCLDEYDDAPDKGPVSDAAFIQAGQGLAGQADFAIGAADGDSYAFPPSHHYALHYGLAAVVKGRWLFRFSSHHIGLTEKSQVTISQILKFDACDLLFEILMKGLQGW